MGRSTLFSLLYERRSAKTIRKINPKYSYDYYFTNEYGISYGISNAKLSDSGKEKVSEKVIVIIVIIGIIISSNYFSFDDVAPVEWKSQEN